MTYTRNAIYTRIRAAVMGGFPNAYCTSRYVAKPSTFPTVYIHEIDNFRPQQFTQLDFQDNQWESVFEVQVVSNKPNTAATEAYAIFALAEAALNDLYYRKFSTATQDTGDTFAVIGRFRRRVGGGDEMPPTN